MATWSNPEEKTWSVNELANATNMNKYQRDNALSTLHRVSLKSSDFTSTNQTLANVTDMKHPAGTNENWYVQFWVYWTNSATGAIKTGFTGPASSVWTMTAMGYAIGLGQLRATLTESGGTLSWNYPEAGLYTLIIYQGQFATAGTAGDLQFQASRNSADGTTTVRKGSLVFVSKLS